MLGEFKAKIATETPPDDDERQLFERLGVEVRNMKALRRYICAAFTMLISEEVAYCERRKFEGERKRDDDEAYAIEQLTPAEFVAANAAAWRRLHDLRGAAS